MTMTQTVEIEKEYELSGYILLHRAIERNLRLIEQHSREQVSPEIGKVQKISDWWKILWFVIEHHHLNEDKIAFPAYIELDSRIREQLNALTADHHVLDDLVIQIGGFLKLVQQPGANRIETYGQYMETLGKFNSLMFDHLDREEKIVLAAEETYYTPEELDSLHTKILKATTMKVLSLEAPFLFYDVDPKIEKYFLKNVPLFLKLIYALSWKGKYRRLMALYMA